MATAADKPSFTCFPKLPLELRLKIWKDISHTPRFVDIWASYHGVLMGLEEENEFVCTRHVTICSVPPVLHPSQEARREAVKHYKLSFGISHTLHHGIQFSAPPRIYVNLESDIICPMALLNYRPNWHVDMLKTPGLSRIALNIKELEDDESDILDFTELCPSLKEIILYRVKDPFRKTSFPFYRDNFEVDFREFSDRKPKRSLQDIFNYHKGAIEDEHEAMIEAEYFDSIDWERANVDIDDNDEASRFFDAERKRYLREKPVPTVRFMRIFVNGIDVDKPGYR
ncbi:uncharacterized protein PAC_14703 [Phialocephala subalpina]|uniref:2EXR domain-containing protein n=1 Tax=Phialocephala subalpina TaxID=576137 RepID=A0A1L7XIF5_9HELO|nr:uncharacterized protein PAC_14703 [Phialocephala subalpina]